MAWPLGHQCMARSSLIVAGSNAISSQSGGFGEPGKKFRGARQLPGLAFVL